MTADRIDGCTGVLVAGGRATRMGGVPKGLLRIDGEPIASRTLRLFGTLFPSSLVIAGPASPYGALGVPVVPDRIPGKGVPGGVHAALASATTEWIFAAGCDMPHLAASPIRLLASHRAGVSAVLVRFGSRLHPLHAFWSRACLPTLERLLLAGDPSLHELVRSVPAHVVEEAEWSVVDPGGRALENVNTPEDAVRLRLGHQE